MQGKEEEYRIGKRTLEQEYKSRLQETVDLSEKLEEKEKEVVMHTTTIADLQEVVTNQKGEKETLEKVFVKKECDVVIEFAESGIGRI